MTDQTPFEEDLRISGSLDDPKLTTAEKRTLLKAQEIVQRVEAEAAAKREKQAAAEAANPALLVEKIDREHVMDSSQPVQRCDWCGETWPCTVSRAAVALTDLHLTIERVRTQVALMDIGFQSREHGGVVLSRFAENVRGIVNEEASTDG